MGDSTADTNTTTPKAIALDVVPSPDSQNLTAPVEPAKTPASTSVDPRANTAKPAVPPTPAPTLKNTTPITGSTAVIAPDPKPPASNTPQKLEIQLQSSLPLKSDSFEAKVVIPWIVAVVGWGVAIALYCLTRRNKINDDLNDIVIEDIKEFLEKIEELTRLVAAHQGGCPCLGSDLKESRKHLTTLRQTAMAVSNRVHEALLNNNNSEEWKLMFREWKTATEGNTDWITNKNNKWSREKLTILERANEEYTGKIINFRNRVVTRRIKLKS